MKSLFKSLVIALGVLYLLSLALPYAWGRIHDPQTIDALAWNGFGGLIDVQGPVPLAISASLLLSLVGLYLLRNWGRHLFAFTLLIAGLLSPLWGIVVGAGIDLVVSYFFAVGSGVVLSLAYFSKISDQFK